MTRLNWNTAGQRFFEAGLDRGVLYVGDAPGVPWMGLTSVTEKTLGVTIRPRYLDGIKITNGHTLGEAGATIEAYTYPSEFEACDGTKVVRHGLRAAHQRRKKFSMAYRTRVGNDLKGVELAYKIHLLYNGLAEPADKQSETLSEDTDAFNFSWEVTTQPVLVEGLAPSAHFTIDSRDTPQLLLEAIEDILYGTENTAPRIPSPGELVFMFDSYLDNTYDAGDPLDPVYVTYDAGAPGTPYTKTIDGGAP